METINVTIQGVSPLLCNRFTDEAMQAADKGSSGALTGDRGSPRQQAEPKLYIDSQGKPVIPQPNIFRSIVDAGCFFKAGKKQISTAKTSLIPACLSVVQIEIPIRHKEPWEVDTRSIVNPATGGRRGCHRPKFNDWELSFDMELDESMISSKLMREIVDKAGKCVGLGDFRPSRKGPFGRYVVTKWEVKKNVQDAALAA